MRDSGLKHQRIIANAGSGKTHRLATRYIELLEREVPAERIVALTFTRKAAGEFLDAIFKRLVRSLVLGPGSARSRGKDGDERAFIGGVSRSSPPTHR